MLLGVRDNPQIRVPVNSSHGWNTVRVDRRLKVQTACCHCCDEPHVAVGV